MDLGISIQHLFMQDSKSHIKNVRSCANAGQWGLPQIISLSDDYNVKKFSIRWVKKDLKLHSHIYGVHLVTCKSRLVCFVAKTLILMHSSL